MAHYTTVEEHPAPARLMHWLHLISMLMLIISGFYISDPFLPGLMGLMRGLHFTFMFLIVIVAIARVIWAFVGKSAPLGSRDVEPDYRHFGYQRQNRGTFFGTVAYYLFLRREAPQVYKYNTLQKGTYVFWLLLIIAQAVTGFALWTPLQSLFLPLTYAVGGPMWMRSIHYIIMWLFIITTLIHIYLSALHRDQVSVMFWGREPEGGHGMAGGPAPTQPVGGGPRSTPGSVRG